MWQGVKTGRVIFVEGKSGSGKTTLAVLLAVLAMDYGFANRTYYIRAMGGSAESKVGYRPGLLEKTKPYFIPVEQALLTAGISVLVISSSAAVRTLQSTIGAMQGGSRFRGVWGIAFSVVFSLVLVAGLYVTMLIMLAGRGLIGQLNSIIPIIDISGSWEYMRFLLLGGIQLLLLWGIYLISRREGERYRTYPGAILASFAILGVSFAFSAFIGASVRYPLVYGSLASLILLMHWLYSCSLVIFCGAALNIAIRDWKLKRDSIT